MVNISVDFFIIQTFQFLNITDREESLFQHQYLELQWDSFSGLIAKVMIFGAYFEISGLGESMQARSLSMIYILPILALSSASVNRIMNFGAFVDLGGGKEGMVHISKLSNKRVEKVEDVVKTQYKLFRHLQCQSSRQFRQ